MMRCPNVWRRVERFIEREESLVERKESSAERDESFADREESAAECEKYAAAREESSANRDDSFAKREESDSEREESASKREECIAEREEPFQSRVASGRSHAQSLTQHNARCKWRMDARQWQVARWFVRMRQLRMRMRCGAITMARVRAEANEETPQAEGQLPACLILALQLIHWRHGRGQKSPRWRRPRRDRSEAPWPLKAARRSHGHLARSGIRLRCGSSTRLGYRAITDDTFIRSQLDRRNASGAGRSRLPSCPNQGWGHDRHRRPRQHRLGTTACWHRRARERPTVWR